MPVLLCLNELSVATATAQRAVDEAMNDFVDLLRTLRQWRNDVTLMTQVALASIELANGYYIQQWIGADPANRDRWRTIRGIQNRAPFSLVLSEDAQDDVEYRYEGKRAEGIGVAHLLDGLAISLRVDAVWEIPWLRVERSILEEDESGDAIVQDGLVDVRHAATREQAVQHRSWVLEAGRESITTGAAIWQNRSFLFPHLTFLPRVEDDLRSLRLDWVHPALEQLRRLEEAIAEWHDENIALPNYRTKVTGEFEMRQREFTQFVDIDGVMREFELHARMTPGPGRIHFRLIAEDRSAQVAYIGRKRD